MNIDREYARKIRKMERQIRQKFLIGLGTGVLIAVVVLGFLGRGSENKDEKIQKKEEQKTVTVEKTETKVVDTKEVAKLNASSLSSKEDNWKLTLVNNAYPLDTGYAPELVEIDQDKFVDQRIAEDLQQMLSDARGAGLNPYICSAYRDYEYQRTVFNDTMVTWIAQGYTPLDAYDETAKSVAIPGTSEHATGLALDITSAEFAELDDRQAETEEAKWLAANCWKYGFILRYPPEKSDITGIVYEPWHYRYVGKKAAKEITEQGVTLEEYLGKE